MAISNSQKTHWPLILLRLFIGWHFLYEGVVKLHSPSWTAKGYLLSADGFMNGFFQWLASDHLITVIDTLNIVALLLVGITLILGFYERTGYWVGVVLLASYYLAHPAFPWLEQGPSEGSYWFINKNLIELAALLVLMRFPTGRTFGLASLSATKSPLKST